MSTEARESPRRVLPYDIAVAPGPFLGGVLSRRAQPSPPTWDDLNAAGLIAPEHDPDKWFSPEELATAQWLRSRGLVVASVQRREGQHLRTPHAVAIGGVDGVTIEMKRAVATTNAIMQRIRAGRKQARRVVVDLRGSGVSRLLAEAGIRSGVGMYGDHLDGDLALGWSRG